MGVDIASQELYHNTHTVVLSHSPAGPHVHIEISLQDGVPIYRQIVNQVKYLIASHRLSAGHELPPIRTLAEQLLVNPNTVVKAYRELESEGLVFKRRGAGTYVAENTVRLAKKEQRKILTQRADALIAEAHQLNFSFEEVLELLKSRQAALNRAAAKENNHEPNR